LKRSLIALAVVAMLASCVNAGEIKAHCWPCQFVALEITTIPVTVDVGYYVLIKDQNKLGIKVKQDSSNFKNFAGCLNQNGKTRMVVVTNFEIELAASVSKASGMEGNFKVSLTDETSDASGGGYGGTASIVVSPGTTNVPVCVKLEGNDKTLEKITLGNAPGSTTQIATVKITVKPTATPSCLPENMGGWL
jgi:hypothetical protein